MEADRGASSLALGCECRRASSACPRSPPHKASWAAQIEPRSMPARILRSNSEPVEAEPDRQPPSPALGCECRRANQRNSTSSRRGCPIRTAAEVRSSPPLQLRGSGARGVSHWPQPCPRLQVQTPREVTRTEAAGPIETRSSSLRSLSQLESRSKTDRSLRFSSDSKLRRGPLASAVSWADRAPLEPSAPSLSSSRDLGPLEVTQSRSESLERAVRAQSL